MSPRSKELLRNDEAVSPSRGTSCGVNGAAVCVTITVVSLIGIVGLSALAAGPLHAQCVVQWAINLPCFDVSSLLVNQMKAWAAERCHGSSQKCLYSLVSVSAEDVVATHTTPILRFVDDITFNFSSPSSDVCMIQGQSVSRSWYAILDSGTNYLNMYNLMRGSGLSSSPSFSESTSDRLCTQYSTTRIRLDL